VKHSTGKPTKAQEERFRRLQDLGCIACRHELRWTQPEIHHLVEGQRRLGHDHTIPLCPWHHRGLPAYDLDTADTEATLGPSLARSKRKFVARYGTERALLAEVDDRLGYAP
jgi:hypothetical protein